ncbi:MAG: hypothetical protein JXR37_24910, partial [Kiritimatiellae bacterium]|nr:hypothetical protein [Kiritimatiellia bacterium]
MPVLCPTNVLAVQVFNRSLTSGDCLFDAALSWTVSRLSLEKDADQNGMPDAWETACLSVLPDPSGRTAAADPDEDGLSNLEEWICGSDPTSDSSVFALDVGMTPAGPVVRFTALPAAGTGYGGYTRYYTLEARSFAADTTWQPVLPFTNIAAAGQVVACTNAVAGTPQCYRGRVWLERPQ